MPHSCPSQRATTACLSNCRDAAGSADKATLRGIAAISDNTGFLSADREPLRICRRRRADKFGGSKDANPSGCKGQTGRCGGRCPGCEDKIAHTCHPIIISVLRTPSPPQLASSTIQATILRIQIIEITWAQNIVATNSCQLRPIRLASFRVINIAYGA